MNKMGTWGTSLYANDFACDVRDDYIDKLRRGKSTEEIMKEMMAGNLEIIGDTEEEPIFWFALADTQWNYGRLLPEVKEKALDFLERDEELGRWEGSEEKQLQKWLNVRKELKEKLLSPLPPQKKVSIYRLYKCKWQLGDVFAYQFHEEYSKEKGVYGKYILFRKVEEDVWWPGHVVPSVSVYWWIGNEIPTLEVIKTMPLLPQKFWPSAYIDNPQKEKEYLLDLLVSKEKQIPKEYLTYLGNISGDDLIACRGIGYYCGYAYTEWKNFEKEILEQYYAWSREK